MALASAGDRSHTGDMDTTCVATGRYFFSFYPQFFCGAEQRP